MSLSANALLLVLAFAAAAACLRRIVRRYRTLLGFPRLAALGFAAAAIAVVLLLRALLSR